MARATIGKWGKNLAVRFPLEIEKAVGLKNGERIVIESRGGEIVIHRPDADIAADAQAAAKEIIEEARDRSLGEVTIRELLEEGRRG